MKFNFEGQTGGVAEHGMDIMLPDEILGQLNISEDKYEKIVDELKAGNKANIDYAENMVTNLANYRNMFLQKIGTMTLENKEISDKVTDRLFTLRKLLKTSENSH